MTPAKHEPRSDAFALRRSVAGFVALCVLLQSLWLPFHLASERHALPGAHAEASVVSAELHGRCEGADEREPHRPHPSVEHKQSKSLVQNAGTHVPSLLPLHGMRNLCALPPSSVSRLWRSGRGPSARDHLVAASCPSRAPPVV
ncbi:MAG: hypothetical protein ABL997_18895 [Planctomycetota bacterium]